MLPRKMRSGDAIAVFSPSSPATATAPTRYRRGRAYLEEKGFLFDDGSIKRFPDGRILVIYSKSEIGGFAIHLMQR